MNANDKVKRLQELGDLGNYDVPVEIRMYLNEYADLLEAQAKAEPVAWQFLNHDGKWVNGSEHNRHYENTVEAGYQTRQLYPGPPTTPTCVTQAPVVDDLKSFDEWALEAQSVNKMNCYEMTWARAAFAAGQARAKLGQATDKACSAVVPDELIDAVKEIAGSHTNNEITDRPVWWIIDPRQILKPSVHEFYGTFKGPFFSREAATEYMESHRYRYGKHVKVYCGSCNDAPQFKKLYDISAAMLKGEK